jgi:hypothetical protein
LLPQAAAEAVAAARLLDLDARIASRLDSAALAAELGAEGAAALLAARAAAAAAALLVEAAAREVAALAAALDQPLVLLKGAALAALGVAAAGSRRAGDLDLLAPAGREGVLQAALLARGFAPTGLPGHEHQLPPLRAPSGAVVEVHRMVLGVRPAGGRSATLADLDGRGWLEPAPGLPAGLRVPARPVLAAHALVHGLAHHGHQPEGYPLARTLADLADLGASGPAAAAADGGRVRSEWRREELEARAAALVAADVAPAEAAAAFALARALAAGDLDALAARPEAPAARLLAHLLAGASDPGYRQALKLRLLAPPLTDRGRLAGRAAAVLGALWLTRAQVDAVYGRPAHPLGYLGRRLARPFDLARRLLRAVRAARR